MKIPPIWVPTTLSDYFEHFEQSYKKRSEEIQGQMLCTMDVAS